MQEIKLAEISLKWIEDKIKKIDWLFWKLYKVRDKQLIDDLEFEIYYLRWEMADQYRIYVRNNHLINTEKWKLHLQERDKYNSDLTTTKAINRMLNNEIAILELQEMIIERLEKKEMMILRLANHINNMRIDDLAEQKRNQI